MSVIYTRVQTVQTRFRTPNTLRFSTMDAALRKASQDYRNKITPYQIMDENSTKYGTDDILLMCKQKGYLR